MSSLITLIVDLIVIIVLMWFDFEIPPDVEQAIVVVLTWIAGLLTAPALRFVRDKTYKYIVHDIEY